MAHKDQDRVRSALLPFLMDLTFSEDPAAVQDCTVLNRVLVQGPDPLLLALICPDEFKEICASLNLTEASGMEAIQSAHWRGPGILLEGQGLPLDFKGPFEDISGAWRREALWLFLASMSDCTEEGYGSGITLVERMRRITRSTNRLSRLAYGRTLGDIMFNALTAMRAFHTSTLMMPDANGVPVTNVDHGFYIGYKAGYKVVGVKAGNNTFYGTTPDTTLAEQGVKVDVNISESYGFVRGA